MVSCEKCWTDCGGNAEAYQRILEDRHGNPCSPEEQAGEDATKCPMCDRKTVHQYAHSCMNPDCPYMAVKKGEQRRDNPAERTKPMTDNYGRNSEMNINLYLEPDQIKLAAIVAEHTLDSPDSVDKFAKELNIPVERISAMHEALYLFLHGDGLEAVTGKVYISYGQPAEREGENERP